MNEESRRRTIRSFVKRSGRLTPSQQRALDELWPGFGIDYSATMLDFESVFGRNAPTVIEIGFGDGESLVEMAVSDPGANYLGIEVHEPGVGHCLLGVESHDIQNLRVIMHDAVDVLEQQIPKASLARVNLYFPDPWPKKRHHKRRIVNPPFLELVATRLETGGALHVATDWENYAEHIDETLEASAAFRLAERRVHDGGEPLDRPPTKFERRGLRLGHRIWDWRYAKV